MGSSKISQFPFIIISFSLFLVNQQAARFLLSTFLNKFSFIRRFSHSLPHPEHRFIHAAMNYLMASSSWYSHAENKGVNLRLQTITNFVLHSFLKRQTTRTKKKLLHWFEFQKEYFFLFIFFCASSFSSCRLNLYLSLEKKKILHWHSIGL